MTVAASCLDHASLKKLLEEGTDSDVVERLAAHLETCAPCGEMVESLLAADPTAAALRGNKIAPDEPSVQLLRARLSRLRPAAASLETTSGANTQSAPPAPSVESTKEESVSLAPPQQPDEIGRLGGYRLLAELGRGGMGVVYKAEDLKLKRLVALKVMAPSLAADVASRQRFLREAVAMAAVHHDNIAVIHTVDEDSGVPFLAMEFLQGMPLDKWLKGGRKPNAAQVLKLGREIAEGLAAAHERGLIHRDIKPGNIWLDSAHKGRVKILDFGLARSGKEDVHLTQSGVVVGTPAFMSPEQARGEKVDARSDLFSLGCVLYRLCTGVMPFRGDTTMALLMSLGMDHPKTAHELNADVPEALSDLVMRLLEKEPAKRPQSAREVVAAIQAISRGLPNRSSSERSAAAVPSLSGPKPAGPSLTAAAVTVSESPAPAAGGKRRRPWVLAVAAGFLTAAVLLAIVIIIRDKNGNKVAEMTVPPDSSVTITNDAQKKEDAVAPKTTVDDAWLKQVAALPAEKQVEAVAAKLKELNPGFDGKMTPTIENGAVAGLEFIVDNVTDISPVRALKKLQTLHCTGSGFYKGRLADLSPLKGMPLTNLAIDGTQASDLSPLKGAPLTILSCNYTKVSSLAPLEGAPLTFLTCQGTQVSDLSPLKGMKLTRLWCALTKVSDLAPLKDMPLTDLACGETKVSDLSPLKGMALEDFTCFGTQVSDLSPLKGMPLKVFGCDFKPERDAEILRSIKTLVTINGKPAAEFWKEGGAASKPTADDAWIKQVAALPAEKQVEAVAAKLKELNPGFDSGQMTHRVEEGKVTELSIAANKLTDISPLRALTGLQKLACTGVGGAAKFSDLSPLRGMKLTYLECGWTSVSDVSALKGMPLTYLNANYTQVADLSPLKGMPLTGFRCFGTPLADLSPLKGAPLVLLECCATKVADLEPLKGAPLENLQCFATEVSDLSPLRGMPLKGLLCNGTRISDLSPLKSLPLLYITCEDTKVADLSPLKGMKLVDLRVSRTAVSDLSPLEGMPLKELSCDFKPERDAAVLRSIKTLETINGKPAAEFWKEAGAAATPPVEDAWVKQVAAMPAEKQVAAVAAKLKELNPGFDDTQVTNRVEEGKVTELSTAANKLTDISPLRALTGLQKLVCTGVGETAKFSDISPLRGMKLTYLECESTSVSDLSALQGMPLTNSNFNYTRVRDLSPLRQMPLATLHIYGTPVSDLSPLKGAPLIYLECSSTKITDLTPLKGAPLENLQLNNTEVSDLSPLRGAPLKGMLCAGTRISDLSPLKGLPLAELDCNGTKVADLTPLKNMKMVNLKISNTLVSDLAPLKNMPLTVLACGGTKVVDLSPLNGMPLKEISCDFEPVRDSALLRSVKTLETINGKPAAQFWKEVDGKKQ